MYEQARRVFEIIQEAGAGFEHVIRTRVLFTDIASWEHAARAQVTELSA